MNNGASYYYIMPPNKTELAKIKKYPHCHKNHLYHLSRNELRKIIFKIYPKCARCNFSDQRALQIDHVNNDGCAERKSLGFSRYFLMLVIESFAKKEKKYQILCANCNWIKRIEAGR